MRPTRLSSVRHARTTDDEPKPPAPAPAARRGRQAARRRPKKDANYSTATTTGIEPNVSAALAYILSPITGILFLVLEKTNRFVRFHAAQSTLVGVFFIILTVGIGFVTRVAAHVPVFGWLVVLILTMGVALLTFVLWLILMWRAYSGEKWELPIAGELANKVS